MIRERLNLVPTGVSPGGRAFQERREPVHGGFGRNIHVSHDPERPAHAARLLITVVPFANHAGGWLPPGAARIIHCIP